MVRHIFSAAVLVLVGAAGWRIGGHLSPDALGMAVGMLFGVMAGIPTALILLASQRREPGQERHERPQGRPQIEVQQPPAQVTNNYITHNHLHLPAQQPTRNRLAEIQERTQ